MGFNYNNVNKSHKILKKIPFTENNQLATVLVSKDSEHVRIYV